MLSAEAKGWSLCTGTGLCFEFVYSSWVCVQVLPLGNASGTGPALGCLRAAQVCGAGSIVHEVQGNGMSTRCIIYSLSAVWLIQQLDCPTKKLKWLLVMEMFTSSVNFVQKAHYLQGYAIFHRHLPLRVLFLLLIHSVKLRKAMCNLAGGCHPYLSGKVWQQKNGQQWSSLLI